MGLPIDEYNRLFEQKDGKITRRRTKKGSTRVKIDPSKILTEEQILAKLGIDPVKAIFIRGEVPSSKNSKQIIFKYTSKSAWRHNGRAIIPFITDSKFTLKYKKEVSGSYQERVMDFKRMCRGIKLPLYIEFIFIRATKGRFDFNNLTEAPQDLMVANGWIEDDDSTNMLCTPPPPPGFIVDKNNAGVIIKLSNIYDNIRTPLQFRR